MRTIQRLPWSEHLSDARQRLAEIGREEAGLDSDPPFDWVIEQVVIEAICDYVDDNANEFENARRKEPVGHHTEFARLDHVVAWLGWYATRRKERPLVEEHLRYIPTVSPQRKP